MRHYPAQWGDRGHWLCLREIGEGVVWLAASGVLVAIFVVIFG
jgi:hypothetical protein